MTCPGSLRALGVADPQPRSPRYNELLHNLGKLLQTPNTPHTHTHKKEYPDGPETQTTFYISLSLTSNDYGMFPMFHRNGINFRLDFTF